MQIVFIKRIRQENVKQIDLMSQGNTNDMLVMMSLQAMLMHANVTTVIVVDTRQGS